MCIRDRPSAAPSTISARSTILTSSVPDRAIRVSSARSSSLISMRFAGADIPNPPENVLVVSLDEKTGIQAKAPTKPDMPPTAGRPARREHEYKRNGTQCLFAALKVHEGDVLAMPSKTRNRFDLIRFLDLLDAEIPVVDDQKIVVVSDNLSTRGTQEVTDWLTAHPRWSFQFTPTHASWLNQIEIFFSILYRRLLKHGMFTSEEDLAEQMLAFIETYNQTAKPFKWTYTGKTLEV